MSTDGASIEVTAAAPRPRATLITAGAVLLLVMAVGGLVVYKAAGALKVLGKASAEGALAPKARWIDVADLPAALVPLVDSLNYLSWVFVALGFGVVIGAMVRAFVPAAWLQRTVAAHGARGQLLAALAGAPLMLCSCCIAPVFEGVYERTRRLGPALGMMLAAPALNPAVLAVTFLILPASMGWTRLLVAAALVLGGAAVVGRAFPDTRAAESCPLEVETPSWARLAGGFWSSLRTVAWRSLPAIIVGVVLSVAIAGWVPLDTFATGDGALAYVVIVVVALLALPLALPTFGEIPLAVGLLAAGAPPGAAMALIVAGPAINLPSLLTLGRLTSWRVAVATGVLVFGAAVLSGIAVQIIAS